MQSVRQALLGLITGALSMVIVFGVLFVVLAESGSIPSDIDSFAETSEPLSSTVVIPTVQIATIPVDQVLPASTPILAVPSPSVSATIPPPTQCLPPMGWVPLNVVPGETLAAIASRYLTSEGVLRTGNCLSSDSLIAGSILYVPYVPLPSATACRPPVSWIRYIVQAGDTLYHIGVLYRVTVTELQRGNCIGNQTLITTGEILYVPNVTPSTLTFTPVTPATEVWPTETPAPSSSPEPFPSDTPSPTETPTITVTP